MRERARREHAEAERLEREAARRAAERKRLIEEEIHIASISAFMKTVNREASTHTREELLEMSVEGLQVEQAEKEARAAKRAEDSHFKREQALDFLTKAIRGNEAHKLYSWIEARLQEDGSYAAQQEARMMERAKKLHEDTLVVKERLARMQSYIFEFEEMVSQKRAQEHASAMVSEASCLVCMCVVSAAAFCCLFVVRGCILLRPLSLESSGLLRSVSNSDH